MNESSPRAEYHYSIYGVRVTSDCPFQFTAADSAGEALAHVRITHRAISPSSESASDAWFACRQLADGSTYLRWRDLYEFNVAADGSQIACRQLREGDVGVLQNFLFGQALSFALVRQRFEPLHAAVVAIGEVAIGFLGDCTYGKSTLAASFVEAGHRLVTDDLLMIGTRGGRLAAMPGSGRVKLEPDSARAFLGDDARGVLLNRHSTRRSFPLPECAVQRQALPMECLFVLPSPPEREDTPAIEIRPLSRAATCRELLKNSFNIEILDNDRLARQLTFAADIASRIDACQLRYPRGLHHLDAVRESVVEHVQRRIGRLSHESDRPGDSAEAAI